MHVGPGWAITRMSSKTFPSLELELEQAASLGVRFVIGVDEVGRGALAGPVAVGAALVDLRSPSAWPAALRDSKLISEPNREILEPKVQQWVLAHGVGMVSAAEIEADGIVTSLRTAGSAAISQLLDAVRADSRAAELVNDGCFILLDGSHNWLGSSTAGFRVITQTKADRDCVSVAAASVLAKVARDRLMIALDAEIPAYGFAGNKGYSSTKHIEVLKSQGPSREHRVSWLSKILANDSDETNI